MNIDPRSLLEVWLLEQEGKPYVWAAKGIYIYPSDKRQVVAYDCSGLVTCGIKYIGGLDLRQTHNAARLFDTCKPTVFPKHLDLCFYGVGRINHVMFYWEPGTKAYGSHKGNQFTLTPELAAKDGAGVGFVSVVRYRPDFRGFRSLPV